MPSACASGSPDELRDASAEFLARQNDITPHDAPESLPPATHGERLSVVETPVSNGSPDAGASATT